MGIKSFIVNLTPGPLVKVFAKPYIAGDSITSAIQTAKDFWDSRQVCSTIDLLGEELESDEEVEYTIDVYLRLIAELGRQKFSTISLKPTQLGSHRDEATCRENIRKIIEAAEEYAIPVTIDMEDHHFTDLTLNIYKALKPDFPTLGTVLQSRLFRTDQDILDLKGLNARIRICIGIYNEPREIALQHKNDMKKKMLEHVELLFKEGHYPEIGTHEEWLIRDSLELADKLNISKNGYEIQMLMGVPRQKITDELIRKGITVRLYVPFAEKWKHATNYCKRRLAANPMMAAYVAGNLLQTARGKK
ncbi:MAG: proline dehydrogenase family protein [Acidobacteria bacterium]|nr:proline dehydrogenase family protein [Acidobacteriota bacterium]